MATEKNEIAAIPTVETTALIAVTQLPIITERLREVKTAIEAMVEDAKGMVATADTIQAVKARRAELNKQFTELESRRKDVKTQIMEPYNRFEAVYRECVAMPFKEADASLKATVDEFESEIKKRTLKRLEDYYYELCALDGIDWLPFGKAMQTSGVKISLTDCKTKEPKKAMEALGNFVSKIGLGIDQIRKMEDSAEILVEYKKTLDVGAATAAVHERKRKIQEEAEEEKKRKEAAERQREMVAKVETAAPAPTVSAPPESKPMVIGFKIYFKSAEEYEIVKPILVELRNTLKREGIEYGK